LFELLDLQSGANRMLLWSASIVVLGSRIMTRHQRETFPPVTLGYIHSRRSALRSRAEEND